MYHPTPPPAYTVGSGDLVVEEVNPPRPGTVRWWDQSFVMDSEQIPFLGEDRRIKNSVHREPFPLGQAGGYPEDQLGIINREVIPPLAARTPEGSPSPPPPPPCLDLVPADSVRGQEEYSQEVHGIVGVSSGSGKIVTVSDSDSQTSKPRGVGSRASSPD